MSLMRSGLRLLAGVFIVWSCFIADPVGAVDALRVAVAFMLFAHSFSKEK